MSYRVYNELLLLCFLELFKYRTYYRMRPLVLDLQKQVQECRGAKKRYLRHVNVNGKLRQQVGLRRENKD